MGNTSEHVAAIAGDARKDAAIAIELPPGGYTATVSGKHDTTGVALVEVHELPQGTCRGRDARVEPVMHFFPKPASEVGRTLRVSRFAKRTAGPRLGGTPRPTCHASA